MRNMFIYLNHSFSLFTLAMISSFICSCERPVSNGESIYFSGKNVRGDLIQAIVDRSGLRDPEMLLACASCHGDDRKGRRNPIPDFGPFLAPSLTRESLLNSNRNRPAYDNASLATAIRLGKSPQGKMLHYPMPRWQFTDHDMDDLIHFLLDE